MVTDLNRTYYPEEIPVPYTEVVFDRIMLEIMRGCTRGCRFCQAGMLYRPVRERSMEKLIDLSEKLVASTGYEEISLSSLSSGDYTCLPELIRELMRRMKDRRVSISLPSLRIDSVLKESLEETQQVRKTSLTFAPEAGTQRMRDVINKGVTEADLLEKVRDTFEGGWSSVKLYFMDGLPTETDEDLDGMAKAYCFASTNGDNATTMLDRRYEALKRFGVEGTIYHVNRSCKVMDCQMMEVQRQLRDMAGIPFTSFDGDQADPRCFSEAQYETRIEALTEIMEAGKEAR